MSFDNETVGKLQATELVKAMGDKGGYLQLNGAPSDPNAAQFKKGAESVLKKSDLKLLTNTSYDNPDWSPNNAQKYVTDQLSKFSPSDNPRRLRRQRRPGRRRHRRAQGCRRFGG